MVCIVDLKCSAAYVWKTIIMAYSFMSVYFLGVVTVIRGNLLVYLEVKL
jgi:hypothetical protein